MCLLDLTLPNYSVPPDTFCLTPSSIVQSPVFLHLYSSFFPVLILHMFLLYRLYTVMSIYISLYIYYFCYILYITVLMFLLAFGLFIFVVVYCGLQVHPLICIYLGFVYIIYFYILFACSSIDPLVYGSCLILRVVSYIYPWLVSYMSLYILFVYILELYIFVYSGYYICLAVNSHNFGQLSGFEFVFIWL